MTRPPRRRPTVVAVSVLAAAVLAACVLAVLSGCGAPAPGTTTVIDPRSVPYDLLATGSPTSPADAEVSSAPDAPSLWLVRGSRLAATEITPAPIGTPSQQASMLLDRLVDGPTQAQRGTGLSSALLPGLNLELRSVTAGTARVKLELTSVTAPDATEGPLALGQIVLTLTSVSGIDTIVFEDGRGPIEVPLPGGALTDQPVAADDYAVLLS